MKINKIYTNLSPFKAEPSGAKMNNKNIDSAFMSDFINKLQNTANHNEANDLLFNSTKNGDFEVSQGVLFKHDDYTVQTMFKNYGDIYSSNLKKLSKMNLGIIPNYITTIEKDNDLYIISKIEGTKSGNLIPYREAKNKVSKKDKLAAYKDLQKITKAGIADNKIMNSSDMWFVTPDTNKIVIPSWEQVKLLKTEAERKQALENYYNILFD